MKFYAPKYKQLDLGLLRSSLDELDKTNRWVALGDLLPWTELEKGEPIPIWETHLDCDPQDVPSAGWNVQVKNSYLCRPHTEHLSATRPCHCPWKGQGKDWVRGKDRRKHSRGLYIYRPPQLGSLQREPGSLTTDSTFQRTLRLPSGHHPCG